MYRAVSGVDAIGMNDVFVDGDRSALQWVVSIEEYKPIVYELLVDCVGVERHRVFFVLR
jgi:hypothetical protein